MNYLEILENKKPIDHIMVSDDLFNWKEISESAQMDTIVPYGQMVDFIYNTDFSKYIGDKLKEYILNKLNVDFNNIQIKIITQNEYRQYDENFDNEMKLLEYFNSEKVSVDKKTLINKEILEKAGFEDITNDWEVQYYKEKEGIEDYKSYRIWTDKVDKNPGKVLKLDIDNALSNSGRLWNLHIDNCDCCTVGCAELDNIWQFNILMEVFGSKFRL